MIDKELKKNDGGKRQMRYGGLFSNKEKRVVPGPRYPTSGNVTMATSGTVYRFPNPYGATKLDFLGVVTRLNQSGYVLTINPPLTRIPVVGKIYYLQGNPDHTFIVTGSSSNTSIQGFPTNSEYPSIPTGTWLEAAETAGLFGNSSIVISATSVPAISVRVAVDGVAHLRPAYYFAPQSSASVSVAKQVQKYVQCSRYFLVVDENASADTPEYAATSGENHIVNIIWNGSIVARATVTNYGPDFFEVTVTLATNWVIQGNFICT